MIETFQMQSRFARQVETVLIESFQEAFGENFKDFAGDVIHSVFLYPSEANVFLVEEYTYKKFLFLRVKWIVEIKEGKAVASLKFDKFTAQ